MFVCLFTSIIIIIIVRIHIGIKDENYEKSEETKFCHILTTEMPTTVPTCAPQNRIDKVLTEICSKVGKVQYMSTL